MIINTGNRTDIPAFYSKWFINRIHDGYVLSRNPYSPHNITRYDLSPEYVDIICFGTKNPAPMLQYMTELSCYNQFWSVTITPYDKDIEPNVPDKSDIIRSFCMLSSTLGINCVSWRYDPIFLTEKYNIDFHLRSFSRMCAALEGYTDNCVVSFIDLFPKTKKNFPNIREVGRHDQEIIVKSFSEIAKDHNIRIMLCCENSGLAVFGADVSGCMSKNVLERACGFSLDIPSISRLMTRHGCNCINGNDIGAYNTCGHGCLYCYANNDPKTAAANISLHDPDSPLLTGYPDAGDIIRTAPVEVYKDMQMSWL